MDSMTNNIVSTKDIWKWVGLGWCTTCCGLGWVGFVLWWVGLGFKKLTHVHVWVTIEGEQETALKLLNGTNFNDLEWPLTQISRSRYYSTSITRKWYKIELYLQWTTNKKSHMVYRTAPFSITWFSRSRHSLVLNISQTATDTAIVTVEGE